MTEVSQTAALNALEDLLAELSHHAGNQANTEGADVIRDFIKSVNTWNPPVIIKFLLGECELDGHWYGQDFHGRPKYWWRTYLREWLNSLGHFVPDGMILVKKSSMLEPDFESMGRQILEKIKRIKELTTWKPIETAPRDGTHVLFFQDGKTQIGFFDWCYHTKMYYPSNEKHEVLNPSHWMALPEPLQDEVKHDSHN